MTSRHAPLLATVLEPLIDPAVDADELWEDLEVSGRLSPTEVDDLEIRSSRLTGLGMTGIVFERARWRNTVVQSCELSGAGLEAAGLTRVDFVDCRLTGATFSDSRLQHVRFLRCRMDQVLFRMTTTEHVEFDDCDLRGADFHAAQLSGAVVHDCNLGGTDFSQATMTGAKLHGSNVADLIGSRSLSGVEIDATQITPMALNVFTALGIDVTERD